MSRSSVADSKSDDSTFGEESYSTIHLDSLHQPEKFIESLGYKVNPVPNEGYPTSVPPPVAFIKLPTEQEGVNYVIEKESGSRAKVAPEHIDKDSNTENLILWTQVTAALVAGLAHISLGAVIAYPAVALPYLYPKKAAMPNDNSSHLEDLTTASPSFFTSDLVLTPTQAAWFGGIHTGGAVLGSLCCGWLMAKLGQRRAILYMAPMALLAWLSVWLAPSIFPLFSARVISGFCIGIGGTSAQMYIIETAHSSIRGALTGIADVLVGIGVLFTYGLGATGLGWRWIALTLGVATCLPLMIALPFFPDSPRWLATKGREDAAISALTFLRGPSYNIDTEMKHIRETRAKTSGQDQTFIKQMKLLKLPIVYIPFLTICGVYFLNQMSGNYVIYSYTVFIFQTAGTGLSAFVSAVMVGVARVCGSLIGLLVVERAGRRPAMMIGGIGVAITFFVLGLYFWLRDSDVNNVTYIWWLPLTVLFLFTLIFAATTSPIPFLLAGELLPLSFRSIGSSLGKAIFFLTNLLITLTFPSIVSLAGASFAFWMYSLASICLSVFVYFYVPETRGRSLEQIEEWFAKRTHR